MANSRLDPAVLQGALLAAGVDFFTGVPDSLLASWSAHVARTEPRTRHVTAANEGGALALAVGHRLASGGLPLVYLQNSGLGNLVNPVASLAAPEVYGIPLLLLIGWRAPPGVLDEPQHRLQGRMTQALLDLLGIPHEVLPAGDTEVRAVVARVADRARARGGPAALLVEPGRLADHRAEEEPRPGLPTREQAIACIVASLGPADVVVCTTGGASRELLELRAAAGEAPGRDFLCVGSMGHASQIALGIALSRPERRVVCLDGDGALLMHMGGLATIGACRPARLHHIVLINGVHESVGGQPTAAPDVDVPALARACGYRWAARADAADPLSRLLVPWSDAPGPALLEVHLARGFRPNLGRPTLPPQQSRAAFEAWLRR